MAEATLREVADALAERLGEGALLVAATGAGISRASGIPTFRGNEGIWSTYRAEDMCTIDMLEQDPALFWKFHDNLRAIIANAVPNPAHFALADIEEIAQGRLITAVITQNIDRLHQRAGSNNVIELHGDALSYTCMDCKMHTEELPVPAPTYPPECKQCGGILRPDVVLFGEGLPIKALDDANYYASNADVMLVVGTSMVVEPAASLPYLALGNDALVVEINTSVTPISRMVQYSIQAPAASALPHLLKELKCNLGCA